MGLMYSFSGRPPLTRGELLANLNSGHPNLPRVALS